MPTPLNINLGSDRFAMFNKKWDIPWQGVQTLGRGNRQGAQFA